MSEADILECLRGACRCALKKDMRGYSAHMEQARAEIARAENARGGISGRLRGELVMASCFVCERDLSALCGVYREALSLLKGPSRLFPRGSQLFADYYNVFAICNVKPSQADRNAELLAELVPLFHALTGGGEGTDICYRAQLAYYRGDIDAALPLAKAAFNTAEKNNQGMVALCAAELLSGIAKHKKDTALWRCYVGYIQSVAESAEAASPACREQAELQRYMQDLSLGFLHTVPEWIKTGDFGAVSAPWGWELTEDKIFTGSLPNALLVSVQYFSYCGNPVHSLLVSDIMRKVYGMDDVILNAYLSFFRAGCFLQLGDTERVRDSLKDAVKALAPDGLWLIAAEFAPAFGELLYEITDSIDKSGTKRIREIGANYWDKLAPFREEIMRSASLGLTRREKEISELLLSGKSNAEIAERLNVSERTVKGHITGIFSKYNIYRRGQLAGAMQTIKEARLADWTK